MGLGQDCRLAALGIVNALGRGAAEIYPRLIAGDQTGLARREDLVPGRALVVGAVTGELPTVPERLAEYDCRNNALSLAALAQIRDQVDAAISTYGAHRVGVIMGTSTSGVGDAEGAIRHREFHGELSRKFRYAQLEFGGAAGFLSEYLGLGGPAFALSTACSSGARALASARSLIRLGVCDAVLCGATDSLCGLTANGFSALGAVSDEVVNPFSAKRSGLTLGEGAALFLVDGEAGGIRLSGVGESSEAHHISAPDPQGGGAAAAMRGALADAQLISSDIAYINLHGTGTPSNDAMEARAVAEVFPTCPPVSSAKALVGHTLGAAGATEAGFCWLLLDGMQDRTLRLIPHCWDGVADETLPELPFASVEQSVELGETTHVMTTSYAFGGNNCALILSREER